MSAKEHKLKDFFLNGLKTNDPFFLIKFIKKNGLSNSDTAENIIKFLSKTIVLTDHVLFVLILTSTICNNEFICNIISDGFTLVCKHTSIHNNIDSKYKDCESDDNNKRKRDSDSTNEYNNLEITKQTTYKVNFNPFFEHNGISFFKFLIDNKEFDILDKILRKLVNIDNLLSFLTENNDEVIRIHGLKFKRKDIIYIFEAAFHTNNFKIVSKILKDPLSNKINNEILDGIQLCYDYFDIYDISYYDNYEPVEYENKIDFVILILKLRMNILFSICYASQIAWNFGLDDFVQGLEIPLIVSEKLPEFLLKYDENYYDNVDVEDFDLYE